MSSSLAAPTKLNTHSGPAACWVFVFAGDRTSHLDSTYSETLVEMEGGAVGTVDASKVGPAQIGRYEFIGSSGQLQGDQIHGLVEFIKGTSIEKLPQKKPTPTIISLLSDWRDFLRGEKPNPVLGDDGLAAVKICDACLQSAKEDRWVELD